MGAGRVRKYAVTDLETKPKRECVKFFPWGGVFFTRAPSYAEGGGRDKTRKPKRKQTKRHQRWMGLIAKLYGAVAPAVLQMMVRHGRSVRLPAADDIAGVHPQRRISAIAGKTQRAAQASTP